MTDEQLPLVEPDRPADPPKRRKRQASSNASKNKNRTVREVSPKYVSVTTLLDALDQSEPRPSDDSGSRKDKKNYAERLSNKLAILVANRLRSVDASMAEVLPMPDGSGRETGAASGASKKLKKTDVRYSTFDTGLELLVSIKTYSFRDPRKDKTGQVVLGRYTKNMVRNDHELRAEAMDHHERAPYAVLVALFFIPMRACDDAGADKSSFAHAIMTFRSRTGRQSPTDPHQLFERMFIGLYELEGDQRGEVWFFDVMDKPPRRGRPARVDPPKGEPRRGLLTLDEMVREVVKTYGIRNRRFIEWADEDPESPPDLAQPQDVVAEDDDEEASEVE
ncbi:MAG: hypothetical protein IPF98_04510 [Gemmatimonadetes bacterium]|nr:hypothetical protein [Gemmatimonadota bacterium]